MAITRPSKRSQVDSFTDAAPDAKPTAKLRGKRQPLAFTLPPELVAEVDAVAAEEKRSRVKMIEYILEDFLRSRRQGRAA
jgi:hypothetical protein